MASLPGAGRRLHCSLVLCLSLSGGARAATRHHEWDIGYQFTHSDCVRKLAVTINGQTPDPTIRSTQGDTVVVRVKNSLLTENVAIHWHGIRQIGTPWADGTEGVTQCPILPGDVFTYTFVVDRPGTYMYHARYGIQRSAELNGLNVVAAALGGSDLPGDVFTYTFVVDRPGTYVYHALYGMQRSAGLNGLIVVAAAPGGPDAEPFEYDGEHSVLLNDWWHKSTYEQAAGLASVPLVWVLEPQSLLINSRDRFVNCSARAAGACNATHPECAAPVFAVVPGKTYRFRIASVTSLSALNLEIEGYPMTFVLEKLSICLGETYCVLIMSDQDPNRSSWLAFNVVSRKPGTATGTVILSYYGGRSSPRRPPPTTPHTGPAWNDTMCRFRQSVSHPAHVEAPPPRADRTILLLNTQNEVDKRIKWALNNVSFTLPHTPYLVAMKGGLLGAFDQRPPPETYAHDGKPHSLLIIDRGRFVNCWTMPTGACNATLSECATPVLAVVPGKTYRFRIANLTSSLSALNFEIEGNKDAVTVENANRNQNQNQKAGLIAHANESITVEAVASGATRTGPLTIAYYHYLLLGAAVVFVVCLAAGSGSSSPSATEARSRHPVADQEPATAEVTITRSAPAPSASDSPATGGDQTPLLHPPSVCSSSGTGPAGSNPSSTPSTPPSGGSDGNEDDPSGPPPPPPQRPDANAVAERDDEGPLLTFVIALWAYDAGVVVAILHELGSIVSGWSMAPKVVYIVSVVLVIPLWLIGLMAAGCHVLSTAGNINMLWFSAFSVKLGAILCSDLLVVAISCELGRWGCVAAVPSAAVITCIMAAVWIRGNEHAVVRAVGRLRPPRAGDDMA